MIEIYTQIIETLEQRRRQIDPYEEATFENREYVAAYRDGFTDVIRTLKIEKAALIHKQGR